MNSREIKWKIHCNSSAEKLFKILSTYEGRECFWAEESREIENYINFVFPNGKTYKSEILHKKFPERFSIDYFDSVVTFQISPLPNGGCNVTLTNTKVDIEDFKEVLAGWVSVLLALKAYADFGVDLRNHHSNRTWDQFYVDN